MEVTLTHEGLSRLGSTLDFELRTDKGTDTILCSRSQISFISPVVSYLLRSDSTLKEFRLQTPNSSRIANCLRSLLNGSPATISGDLVATFRSVSLDLGNDELFCNIRGDLSIDNVHEILRTKQNMSLQIGEEIDFIASHFYELDRSMIASYDIMIIDSILSSESLVVDNERSLFEFIVDLITSRGDEYQILLSHLHLEYLDSEDISSFIEFINEDSIGSLLPCIYRRLFCPLADLSLSSDYLKRVLAKSIPFNGDNFDGIFSHMWKVFGCNPVTKEVVAIEDTTNRSQGQASNIVDPAKRNKTDWWFGTHSESRGSIIIDFKDQRVSLTGYSLKSPSSIWGNVAFMKSWKLEGSNDRDTWAIIDEQKDSNVLISNMAEGHWPCKKSSPFRFFRIMLTDKNSSGNYQIGIHAIELMGTISK